MSSLQRGGSGQVSSAFELSSKKKFGKNLNKLQKPPPPPISNGTSRGSGSSRNGLLLLSTKRSSSMGNSTGSGLLSNKSTPATSNNSKPATQPLAIRNESYASTHDALVDAVMGASRNDSQKEPDAWGAAEKQGQPNETPNAVTSTAEFTPSPESHTFPHSVLTESGNGSVYEANQINFQQDGDRYQGYEDQGYSRHESDDSWRRPESDDSWRRSSLEGSDDQATYMVRLARERAERRREDEEVRVNEQRERATKRLLELEHKLDSSSQTQQIFLQNEGKGIAVAENGGKTRTLYDPNKPYSSLVGGNGHHIHQTSQQDLVSGDPVPNPSPSNDGGQPDGPIIHISNYEDRDRGERNGSGGPRMLFDPKSGSMVAVTESKGKKVKPKGRRDTEKIDVGDVLANGKKKAKGRNEPMRKDRRRVDSIEISADDETTNGISRKARPGVNRLPRTCGVLYVRDEKGACYSADGCDGDQGYGCHGVPGGRIRNPSDYAKFQEEHQHMLSQETGSQDEYGEFSVEDEQDQFLHGYVVPSITPSQEPVIDWVKRNERIELLTGDSDSPTLRSTAVAWRPSQAALAAALEMRNNKQQTSNISVESVLNTSADEDESDPDDPDAYVGLGFDPSNMDAVMSSPSVRAHTTQLDEVDLSSLTLGVSSSDGKSDGHSRNIFAFGTSSTWGSTGANKGASDAFSTTSTWGSSSNHTGTGDWGVLGGATALGPVTDTKDQSVAATSFLSLSSTNTWGTTSLFGNDRGTTAD